MYICTYGVFTYYTEFGWWLATFGKWLDNSAGGARHRTGGWKKHLQGTSVQASGSPKRADHLKMNQKTRFLYNYVLTIV
jgi:hypothetical protein